MGLVKLYSDGDPLLYIYSFMCVICGAVFLMCLSQEVIFPNFTKHSFVNCIRCTIRQLPSPTTSLFLPVCDVGSSVLISITRSK